MLFSFPEAVEQFFNFLARALRGPFFSFLKEIVQKN